MSITGTFRTLVFALVATLAVAVTARAGEWRPVSAQELAPGTPQVDRDADAEALFWDVRVEDFANNGWYGTVLKHYVRIKVFTPKGKESQSRIDLPFDKNVQIEDIAGRTLRPDGTESRLKSSDIYEHTIVKGRGVKVKEKSFALPGVEVGSIIEYKWTETRNDQLSAYERLQFQLDIPVRRVIYHIKPLSIPGYSMMAGRYHATMMPFVNEADGFVTTSMENVHAFREEPDMPPEAQVRPWLLLYYADAAHPNEDADAYWRRVGQAVYDEEADLIKSPRRIKEVAAAAVAGTTDPNVKLERLWTLCRTKVRNASLHWDELSDRDRKQLLKRSRPDDTLERGLGTQADIALLFAALARAAGFEARIAMLPDRGDIYFTTDLMNDYFLTTYDVAVRVGDTWRFFDPGDPWLSCGQLRWQEQGVPALIPDAKAPVFVVTPETPAESSRVRRTGLVTLDPEGNLQGYARVEFTGLPAVDERRALADVTPDKRDETMRDGLRKWVAGATISDLKVTGADDAGQPLVYSFRFEAPGFASRTGKRLFLQPAVFQHSRAARFTERERWFAIDFHYAWSEMDSIVVTLPEGYTLDHPDAPGSTDLEGLATYTTTLATAGDGQFLIYRRAFTQQQWFIEAREYDRVRAWFEDVHAKDGHQLALLRTGGAPDTTSTAKH